MLVCLGGGRLYTPMLPTKVKIDSVAKVSRKESFDKQKEMGISLPWTARLQRAGTYIRAPLR